MYLHLFSSSYCLTYGLLLHPSSSLIYKEFLAYPFQLSKHSYTFNFTTTPLSFLYLILNAFFTPLYLIDSCFLLVLIHFLNLQIAAKIQPSGQKRPLEEAEGGMDRLSGKLSYQNLHKVAVRFTCFVSCFITCAFYFFSLLFGILLYYTFFYSKRLDESTRFIESWIKFDYGSDFFAYSLKLLFTSSVGACCIQTLLGETSNIVDSQLRFEDNLIMHLLDCIESCHTLHLHI